MIHEALSPLPRGPWDQIFNTEHWKDQKWGPHSRIYIRLRNTQTLLWGENILFVLFVSLIKLDCRENSGSLGF